MGQHKPYFDVDLTKEYLANIMSPLHGIRHEFDTIVVTGVSGQFIGPVVAYMMDKRYCVVRKPDERSHDCNMLVGNVGDRWLFLDDFILTGRTLERVQDVMRRSEPSSTYVGSYQYKVKELDILTYRLPTL